jgi:hypothetical protein
VGMSRTRLACALAALSVGCAGAAQAQSDTATAQPQPSDPSAAASAAPDNASPDANAQPADDPRKWHFSTIGYGWFSGIKGETDVIGPVAPVGLDLSFGTIFKHLKFVFMGAAEARKDRLVFVGDLMWVHLGASKGIDIRDRAFLDADLDSKTLAVTALAGYRVASKGPVVVDVLAGARVNGTKTALSLTGPNRSASGSVSQTWVDPVIAVRANAPLGGKASLTLYGDIAGVLWGSDFSWQGLATVNYQIGRRIRLGAGWRYFKVNYDKGDFLYDVAQSGPIIVFRTDF